MAFKNQPPGFGSRTMYKTKEERDEVLKRYRVHLVDEMLSRWSFYPNVTTMNRLSRDFPEFKEERERIEADGLAAWERLGKTMTKDDIGSYRMFHWMTKNKKGFRDEVKREADDTKIDLNINVIQPKEKK